MYLYTIMHIPLVISHWCANTSYILLYHWQSSHRSYIVLSIVTAINKDYRILHIVRNCQVKLTLLVNESDYSSCKENILTWFVSNNLPIPLYVTQWLHTYFLNSLTYLNRNEAKLIYKQLLYNFKKYFCFILMISTNVC